MSVTGKVTPMAFRASSFCASNECVEVASGILVRDTADRDGPVLTFSPATWRAFTASLKAA
jgi:hypothetical protein